MDMEVIRRQFQAREHLYKHLEVEALFTLKNALAGTGIHLHSTPSRVKGLDSFLEKVERKQFTDPWIEMHDVVGLRVICLFLSDIDRIGTVIRDSFVVISEDNKIEGSDVSSFGYMSVHFIVTMKPEYVGPRYDSISKMPFEIQVRTIAMDAWANVSHHLDYKSESDVPADLKRDFYALSGLFYVADKHFEIFYGASKKSQQEMNELFEEASPEVQADQEINLDSLTAYLRRRFPDRQKGNVKWRSELVNLLLKAGYKSIGDVDRLLSSTEAAFELYEKENPPDSRDKKFNIVGILRISAQLADEGFLRIDRLGINRDESDAEFEQDLESENERYAVYRKLIRK